MLNNYHKVSDVSYVTHKILRTHSAMRSEADFYPDKVLATATAREMDVFVIFKSHLKYQLSATE